LETFVVVAVKVAAVGLVNVVKNFSHGVWFI